LKSSQQVRTPYRAGASMKGTRRENVRIEI
jgi:hypothetical protein